MVPYCMLGNEGDLTKEDDIPYKFTAERIATMHTELPPHFRAMRPSFGCVAYGTNPVSEHRELHGKFKDKTKYRLWVPKFMFYTKYDRPPADWEQRARDGNVYRMCVWWDRPHDPKAKMKWGRPQNFSMWVSKDGKEIRALRQSKRSR